jgi:cell division protein FtsQ
MAAATIAPFAMRAALPVDVRLMRLAAHSIFVLALSALLLALLLWLLRHPVFEIRGIRLAGDLSHNSAATVRANAAAHLQGSFFTIDLAATRAAFESVPWVRRATVSRLWPNRIAVHLEEHRPAAYWAIANGNDKLVNTYGEVFEANLGDVEDSNLPTFAGPEGSAAAMLALHQRLALALRPLSAEIETLRLSRRGSWRAELDTGLVIELGRGSDDELLARADRFVRTVPQLTARYPRALQYADLRHADGYAVRLKGVSTVLAPAAPGKN